MEIEVLIRATYIIPDEQIAKVINVNASRWGDGYDPDNVHPLDLVHAAYAAGIGHLAMPDNIDEIISHLDSNEIPAPAAEFLQT